MQKATMVDLDKNMNKSRRLSTAVPGLAPNAENQNTAEAAAQQLQKLYSSKADKRKAKRARRGAMLLETPCVMQATPQTRATDAQN